MNCRAHEPATDYGNRSLVLTAQSTRPITHNMRSGSYRPLYSPTWRAGAVYTCLMPLGVASSQTVGCVTDADCGDRAFCHAGRCECNAFLYAINVPVCHELTPVSAEHLVAYRPHPERQPLSTGALSHITEEAMWCMPLPLFRSCSSSSPCTSSLRWHAWSRAACAYARWSTT